MSFSQLGAILSICVFVMVAACGPLYKDTFNSRELISSKGEFIYVNTLNWGVTDDKQLSVISSNKKRLKERNDTLNVVRGLSPFIYNFNNDTLKLYFFDEVRYAVKDQFKTIVVEYIVLERDDFRSIKLKSNNNDGYYGVPMRPKNIYPKDMPVPPSK